MKQELAYDKLLEQRGITRRSFLKFCSLVCASLGLEPTFIPKIAEALTSSERPPFVWLHFAECTGCTEAFLRSTNPWIDVLLLENVSVDYHETIMAAAGQQAEENLYATVNKYEGQFFCVVEGAIPTAENGIYGMIAGRTMLDIARQVCPKALATICIGTCASHGGIQAAAPNPTEAKGVGAALEIPTVNIAGCPPNPVNFVGTIVNYLLFGKLPKLDRNGRPCFAYGKKVHDQCPRLIHYERQEFAPSFDSVEAEMGWCLHKLGCKGKYTHNNCPTVKFNDGVSWPVEAGHPCIGCSEPDFWDRGPFYVNNGDGKDGKSDSRR